MTNDTTEKGINEKIKECRRLVSSEKIIACLEELLKTSNDGMVSYVLGQEYEKLGNDIGPKLADPRPTPLADPRPTPRTSWLFRYPEGTQEQKLVSSFANGCQSLIDLIKLADPRPTPISPQLPRSRRHR